MASKPEPARPQARCPTCRKPIDPQQADSKHRPFCSKRCADIDLARWLGGTFVIPGAGLDTADDSTLAAPGTGVGSGKSPAGDDE